MFKEVDYIDGIQEFLESEYITELLEKGKNEFLLKGEPSTGSVRFSGDVLLFKKEVYSENDLVMPNSWMLLERDGSFYIKIHPNSITSLYTYTYVTYISRAVKKQEGLFSVDYDRGFLHTSTGIKKVKISFRKSIQYIEAQQMTQVPMSEYTKETIYNIPTDSDTKLSYIYQIKNDAEAVQTKEVARDVRVSLVTLGDKDD